MRTLNERALILAFTCMSFFLGTTEYIIVGLLPEISSSLGITLAAAGSLVSGFAIAYAVGTPILMVLLSRFSKRTAILGILALIVALNLVGAVSGSYLLLLAIRILTGVLCGTSLSISLSVLNEAVNRKNVGKSISWVLSGFSIANVLGVPIGTFVGQHLEWQAAFVLNSVIGIVVLVFVGLYIPSNLSKQKGSWSELAGLLTNYRIVLAFLIPVLGTAAVFSFYTYITPIIKNVMGLPLYSISLVLLLYGIAAIGSNWLGGRLASGNAVGKLRGVFLAQAVIYLVFSFAADIPAAGLLLLTAISLFSCVYNVTAQLNLVELAVEHSPASRDLASSLLPVGANIGIAIGSSIGGVVVTTFGVSHLSWTAAFLALIACLVTVGNYRLKKRTNRKPDAEAAKRTAVIH
ncbi:MFS transporter [Gorillibacterium timonense]|uniref:MFS transporter n=1 Tax=Gorillibacterium timonense TaxID=1689269 RepID=UPI00071C8470|nr:MFS transporter [Gorillibacterium timonense]